MADANNSTAKADSGKVAGKRSEPPKALFKVVNPVMKALLRSPLHKSVSGALVLIQFKGRKSGTIFSTPVAYHPVEGSDEFLVFTHSPWWHNFEQSARLQVNYRGRKLTASAEAVQDPEVVFSNISQILAKIGVRNARRLGISLNGSQNPTEEELREASKGTVMIRITPISS